jgi:1,2-diacylglycerol 3-beta-glucosyltransferase
MRPSRQGIDTLVTVTAGALGLTAAAPATYLAVLAAAATLPRREAGDAHSGQVPRLAILVPAHNEAELIGRCLTSLAGQDYPADRREVFVIADNCTDGTAAIAADLGATVLERQDPTTPGKGPALRWAITQVLQERPECEAIVVVDADSVTDPALLSALGAAHVAGAAVCQADYEALVDGNDARAKLRGAAFVLFHRVRFTGKARLGLPCTLVGNGMLFSREVCQRFPWSAFSEVEDLEYGLQLRLAGVTPRFVPDAHLVAPVASSGPAAEVQRVRWERGRAHVVRQYLPELARHIVSQRRLDLWDAAADLAVPPLGILGVGIATGTITSGTLVVLGRARPAAALPWAIACAGLATHVLVGLNAADDPAATRRALAAAPQLLVSEMAVRARALFRPGSQGWVRTPREREL